MAWEYKLSAINPRRLEALFHRLFAAGRLDLALPNRFGGVLRLKECFIVPLPVIDEAVDRIRDGSIVRFIYGRYAAALVTAVG